MMKGPCPCNNCICLPVCKTITSLVILVNRCSLLREWYGYTNKKKEGKMFKVFYVNIPDGWPKDFLNLELFHMNQK